MPTINKIYSTLLKYTVRYFSRIPYIPSWNSKAALLIIRSLSWAPADGGLPFSSLSSVKVSLYKRVKQNSISQEPEYSLYSRFHLRVERDLHALSTSSQGLLLDDFQNGAMVSEIGLKKCLRHALSQSEVKPKASSTDYANNFPRLLSATGDILIMFSSNWSNFARFNSVECLYLLWLARTITFFPCLVHLFSFTCIMPYQHTLMLIFWAGLFESRLALTQD